MAARVDDDEEAAALRTDDLDDIAVTIGRVVSIRGSVVWGALFDDDDGTAARAARMGALVSMRGPDSRVFGIVNALKRDGAGAGPQAERTIFEIQVLGEISTVSPGARAAGFQRGVSSYPPLDAPVTTVTLRDLAAVYARPRVSNVHVGRLRHNHKVPAFVLTDSLLGKHFAVLGTTGAGKSCAVTVILRSILDELPNGHIVLLDPHNEYASAFSDRAELLNPSNLQLPYWLLNFEEIGHILIGGTANEYSFAQTAILKDAILRAKRAFLGEQQGDDQITIDTPTPYRLSDLIAALKDGMGALNKADGSGAYLEPDRAHREPAQRPPLRLHVREPRGARQHAPDPRPAAAGAGRRQADHDHRHLGRALGDRRRRGLGAVPAGVRARGVERPRLRAAGAAGLRGGPPLRAGGRPSAASCRPSA